MTDETEMQEIIACAEKSARATVASFGVVASYYADPYIHGVVVALLSDMVAAGYEIRKRDDDT